MTRARMIAAIPFYLVALVIGAFSLPFLWVGKAIEGVK